MPWLNSRISRLADLLTDTTCVYNVYDSVAGMLLHSYWRSSCSYRVRIVLALKDVAYTQAAVHLVQSAQTSPAYALLNPMLSVPTLEIDGLVLTQSPAICEYLEETRAGQGVALLPAAPAARAAVRAVCAAIGCDVQPLGNLRVLRHVQTVATPADASKEEREAASRAWSVKWITSGFHGVEALLAREGDALTPRRFCMGGDSPTLADAFLIPQCYNAERVGIDLSAWPNIAAVAAHCATLAPFQAAHPSAQPDAQPT